MVGTVKESIVGMCYCEDKGYVEKDCSGGKFLGRGALWWEDHHRKGLGEVDYVGRAERKFTVRARTTLGTRSGEDSGDVAVRGRTLIGRGVGERYHEGGRP